MLFLVVEYFRDGDARPVYRWTDLVRFEVIPDTTSADAATVMAPRL